MKNKKVKNIILVLLAVIFAAVLLYSLYQGLIIYIPQKQEQQRFDELQKIVEHEREESSDPVQTEPSEDETRSVYTEEENAAVYSYIERINDDFRGWLRIGDTIIDYPVVKSSEDDPEYYLHRDFDRNYSFSGTPFIGAGADENSDAFVVYAHNMNNGTMFGTLDNYADEGFAEQHRYIEFDTSDENIVYRVFAAFRTTLGSEDEFAYYDKVGKLTYEEYKALVDGIKDASVMYIGECPAEKTQIIMLSTCSYHADNGRFAVAAYRVR